MLCATSWPYAPTFCTGVAPVEPGMPDSVSMPVSSCSTAYRTTSSHGVPGRHR